MAPDPITPLRRARRPNMKAAYRAPRRRKWHVSNSRAAPRTTASSEIMTALTSHDAQSDDRAGPSSPRVPRGSPSASGTDRGPPRAQGGATDDTDGRGGGSRSPPGMPSVLAPGHRADAGRPQQPSGRPAVVRRSWLLRPGLCEAALHVPSTGPVGDGMDDFGGAT